MAHTRDYLPAGVQLKARTNCESDNRYFQATPFANPVFLTDGLQLRARDLPAQRDRLVRFSEQCRDESRRGGRCP